MPPGSKKFVIFYSWESDLPPESGRKLVEDALEGAARALAGDDSITLDLVIDRDTLGIAGAPNIFQTILQKIDDAEAVFADVSIITPPDAAKSTPNPNVLLELGYAVRAKGWPRVVLVMNEHFGKPEKLPFDLRGHRVLVFNSPPGDPGIDLAREQLQRQVEAALRDMLRNLTPAVGEVISPSAPKTEAINAIETEARNRGPIVRRSVRALTERIVGMVPDLAKPQVAPDEFIAALKAADSSVEEYAELCVTAAEFDDSTAIQELYDGLARIAGRLDVTEADASVPRYRHHFEFFGMIAYEMLLILSGALLRERKITALGEVLKRELPVNYLNGPDHVTFKALNIRSGYILRAWRTPRGGEYLSPVGEYFVQKYKDREPSRQSLSLEEIQSADLFLFMALLPPNGDPELPDWVPFVGVLAAKTPRFLTDAVRRKNAEILAVALGQPSAEKLRSLVEDGYHLVTKVFSGGYSELGRALKTFRSGRIATEA